MKTLTLLARNRPPGLTALIDSLAGSKFVSTGRTAPEVISAANSQPGGTSVAFQIVIRLDNGQYATVTQMPNPGVRPGDYVYINNNLVYPR